MMEEMVREGAQMVVRRRLAQPAVGPRCRVSDGRVGAREE